MCTIRDFDAENVSLNGKNLIEASAGTGKTYSIAILVIRMIIEKQIPIEKILMVTFTKAAVAELETRIRKFVRQAYKYSLNQNIDNLTIKIIIDKAGKEYSKAQLGNAVQTLDQLSVMTIHSFCEHSLMQFPFETNQPFKFDIVTDTSEIKDLVINDYWRKNISKLEKGVYKHLQDNLTREIIQEVLTKALEDKEYICTDINENELLHEIRENIRKTDTYKLAFEKHISDNFESIKNKEVTGAAKRFLDKNTSSYLIFMDAFKEGYKKGTQYIQNSFSDEYELYDEFFKAKEYLDNCTSQYIYYSFKSAINDLKRKVGKLKNERNLIDFNDQINFLHTAVIDGKAASAISRKFQAVFIDEFQDTDKSQYEIFSRLFSDKIIFYIGDPKQSIYGWRKADIETYKSAKKEVDTIYSMDRNFRSTEELIDRLNSFFSIDNPFSDNQIEYSEVKMGNQKLGSLTYDNIACNPFEIYGFKNKSEIESFVVNKILMLLSTEEIKVNGKKIKPSDIAIIVRTNRESHAFKESLSKVGVPAITIDDSLVMSSDEAKIIQYLMEAVIQPSRGNINRVILNSCFGINSEFIRILDDEAQLEQFRELKGIWQNTGVYNMLFRFFEQYKVRQFSISMGIQGQRILTNFYHIAEILHQSELKNKYTPTELLQWCKRAQNEDNDEYEQRIESQDEAVQITTIHRCKGLTYKIVFAPYLDLTVKEFPIFEFREKRKYKFTFQPDQEQKILWGEQNEQENRRLIYVALTRAQYKNYLCVNNSSNFKDSSLKEFPISEQKEWVADEKKPINYLQRSTETIQDVSRSIPDIQIKNTFGIHSFSALSRAHHVAPFEKAELGTPDDYNQFVFQDIRRGANVGTALHSIFERLNFAQPDSWEQTLIDASKYYPNIVKEERLDLFWQMADHVMKTEIVFNNERFMLNQIKDEHKLPEMEFLFSINKVNRQKINEILGEEAEVGGDSDMEGLMTGFIDLVFEHNGKYYILDWKSNHLGNSVDNYDRPGMEEAMRGSNYNLQYMIYTVALKRWLESRLPNFEYDKHFGGVVYVFLRGVRENKNTGIFTTKPTIEVIQKLDSAFKN